MVDTKIIGLKYILLQVIILVLIATIPMHFYIDSELKNEVLQDYRDLQLYAQKVANKIYIFSNSNQVEFYFPRSNIFKSAIYDKDDRVIFSLLDDDKGNRYFKYRLKTNIFGAKTLVVSKKITHTKIILNALIILLIIVLLVFLSSFFIIKQSSEPYKKFNRYMENFIKDAMHELKTPIGVILLNLDGLSSVYGQNKMIKRAKSALKNMMVVYEDLEFFVRKSVIKHPRVDIDLSKFSEERVEFFMDLLNSKDISIILNIQENIHVNFCKLELSRLIDNTLSNAIKYSKNSTTIHLNLKKEEHGAILEIRDEGKGIKDINKIFDRYYRGDKISGGFGIGLSIVKNICDKNSVRIEVKSVPSKGSSFVFEFGYR
ncbi:MAG: HAMP domain-containing histidine kinase [Campylobacteraceae bacterium]|nr:HAMP domain-containing histidine kinase [Campylobacteraceae bacterium]